MVYRSTGTSHRRAYTDAACVSASCHVGHTPNTGSITPAAPHASSGTSWTWNAKRCPPSAAEGHYLLELGAVFVRHAVRGGTGGHALQRVHQEAHDIELMLRFWLWGCHDVARNNY